MRKSIAERVDAILKANGAKGIGHLDRFERCRVLALGNPNSRTHANKLLREWLDQFADRTPDELSTCMGGAEEHT